MVDIGYKFYELRERLNTFSRSKETKIIDGEEWYRYDKPVRTYTIHEWTVIGIVSSVIKGELIEFTRECYNNEFGTETYLHCTSTSDKPSVYYLNDLEDYLESATYYFTSREQAEQALNIKIEKDRGI